MENYVLMFIFSFISLICIFPLRHISLINPVIGFLVFNWIMGVGSINIFNFDNKIDQIHLIILIISPFLFTFGAYLGFFKNNIKDKYDRFWGQKLQLETLTANCIYFIIFVVSVFAIFFYYKSVGYNLFISNLTGSGIDDFSTMRLEAYSGENYFAPGYANQFKNTLYPIIFFYYLFFLRILKSKFLFPFLLVFGALLMFSVLGTGQRTFLVFTFIIFLNCYSAIIRKPPRLIVFTIIATVTVLIFFYLSIQLNRTSGTGISSLIGSLLFRVFVSNQESSVYGFHYIYPLNIPIGSDWIKSVSGLLPGNAGSDIANQIHGYLYGSTRGTAPLSIWGSIYYNFGFIGIILAPFLIGFLYMKTYEKFLEGDFGLGRLCIYSGLFFYLSVWISGDPVQLINNGLLTVIFLLALRSVSISYEKKVFGIGE